ncbi:hypothetical protein Z946_3794 [Sulfitobacter noctilucicola]|uniref:Uncharacterized protein n=1 Tax=Sulfitobacter noctilucicola TaxID=1342301 RepID=A0A7W6M7V9_9RHOB|nr:hypothetical protein [Sulfitobacter noctilucicola]KIN64900.1 hypothetical protein Z946_3794 [Sulfitobacter noctilucicola]MBB4173956.1 hypothetical protein [Sulfitobacter noctilucicola]
MATKADTVVVAQAEAIRQFTLGQNMRVEAWIAENWERVGLTGPIHKSTVSKALTSMPVVKPVADALDVLFSEMRDDPWAWCKPPSQIEDMPLYAPINWWFKTLRLKDAISWTRFERMSSQPLSEKDRSWVQERLDEWSEKLKAACDQFQTDRALVRALEADEDPEFQTWFVVDGEWRLDELGERVTPEKELRRRAGNAGLHGRSEEEIGLAWALADSVLTLPDIPTAKLTYSRPRAVSGVTHFSEPVEPWNDQEFEGVEVAEFAYDKPYTTTETYTIKHRVCFYWAGDRYKVEDIEPFAMVKDGPDWREATMQEKDLFMTGIKREHLSRDEMMAIRDEWIDETLAGMVLRQDEREPPSGGNGWKSPPTRREEYPDGIPRSLAEGSFEAMIGRIDDEAAADEQREVARRRMAFMRQLRRR